MRKESRQHFSHSADSRAAVGLRTRSVLPSRAVAASPGRRRFTAAVLLFLTLVSPSASADQLTELVEKAGLQIVSPGNSDSELQRDARRKVPLQLLTASNRQRAEVILKDCSQFRRLPALRYSIDRPIYSYLLQHPDVAVSTWRAMGISRFEMLQTGPMEFEARAVDGSEGIADILYQDDAQTLFICEGLYHNLLLPRPLKASALIWFRADFAPGADGCQVVTQTVDVFACFPSTSVAVVAKMLTPVTNSMMDRNLYEISLYASMMSRAVRDEPEWVIQVARQLDGVLPQRPEELIAVARLPRKTQNDKSGKADQTGASATGQTTTSAVPPHNPVVSPKLLFFDPSPHKPGSQESTRSPVSSGGSLLILPASRRNVPKQQSQSGNSGLTDPEPGAKTEAAPTVTQQTISDPPTPATSTKRNHTVPPAGSTATGPVGSRTGNAGN